MSYDGKVFTVATEYEGEKYVEEIAGNRYTYYLCDDVEECTHNTAGVLVENMSRDGKAYYYIAYLSTQFAYYYPYNGGYIECYVTGKDLNQEVVITTIKEKLKTMKLRDDFEVIKINNSVILKVALQDFKMRPNEVIIPGVIRVKSDDGSIVSTSTMEIGGVQVGVSTVGDYTCYQYNGVLIQIMNGLPIDQYVTFIKQK